MSDPKYPPSAFYFTLRILEKPGVEDPSAAIEARFQEVSGVALEFDTEPIVEGGADRFVHRLPRPAKHLNLVLKRGVITTNSLAAEWIERAIGENLASPIQLCDLMLTLSNEAARPLMIWVFAKAYPVRCLLDPRSQDDNILIETLEFAYTDLKQAASAAE